MLHETNEKSQVEKVIFPAAMPPKRRINLKPNAHRKGAVYKKHAPHRAHKNATFRPQKAKKAVAAPVAIVVTAPAAAAPRTALPVQVVVPARAAPKKHKKYVASKKKKTIARSKPVSKIAKVVVVAPPASRRNAAGVPAPPLPPRSARYDVVVRVPPPLPVRRARAAAPPVPARHDGQPPPVPARAARTTLPVEVVVEGHSTVVAPPGVDPSLMQARRLPAAEQLQAGAAKLKKAAAAAKRVENTMANALQAAMDARRAAINPVGNDVGGDSDGDAFNDTVVIPAAAASSNIDYALNDPDEAAVVMPGADEMGGAHVTEVMPGDDAGEAMEGTGMVAALGMDNE